MWTLDHYRRYRRDLTLRSILNLRAAIGAAECPELDLQLRSPRTTVRLRPKTIDLWTFDDIFLREIYRVLRKERISTMLDLGANIGLVGLYVLARNPDCRIAAVEPDSENFSLLAHNLPSARRLNAAMWHSDATVTFSPDTSTTGQVTNAPIGHSVQGLTMASLVAWCGFSRIDLIKVDIEGAERHLLAGDRDWLGRVERLLVEWHGDSREASEFDVILPKAGFSILEIDSHTTYAQRSPNP
jgi:FkbM family methyltransferase